MQNMVENKEKLNIEKVPSARNVALDIYRIIACLLVIINHNSSKVMIQVEPKSLAWFVTIAVFYITKIAVPGFFMIAGCNLIHKRDDWHKSWIRVRRILVDLAVFTLVYYIWKTAIGVIAVKPVLAENALGYICGWIVGVVDTLWHGPITDAFWYLYAYLGLMIILPFLQKLASAMSKKDLKVFLGLSVIFASVIPTLSLVFPELSMAEDFVLPIVVSTWGSVAYMMFGHYIYMYGCDANKAIWLVLGFAAGFAMNMISTVVEFSATGGEEFLSMGKIEYVPLALESVCFFLFLQKLNYSSAVKKVVTRIAPITFGVYLLTDFVCTNTHMVYFYLCPYMNRLLAVAIQDVVVVIVAFVLSWILRCVPAIKNWI